jgi:predicted ATPase
MKNVEDRIERIVDVRDSIDLDKVTILTGGNGGGKSFIRKQIQLICKNESIPCWTVSLDQRAGFDSNGTGMMVFGRDCEWLPSSVNTFDHMRDFGTKTHGTYGILDEIEIGMSEESQCGAALYINKQLEEFRKNNRGLLIITHSRHIVRYVDADEFINIEGMTKQEWLDREIIPTDFDSLDHDSSELFRALQDKMNAKRNS